MNRPWAVTLLCWAAVLVLAWLAYAPGLGGVFLLDDGPNLSGLASIGETGALEFVLGGEAGPTGRPLALLTFVPQAAAWNVAAEPFLRVNILIHLANACLLAWVLYALSRARGAHVHESRLNAFAAAAVWLLLPMLASSSLMIIQRMTTLSATCVLLGLGAYLTFRGSLEQRPRAALAGMSLALVVGTLLAVFTKENGALLPVFVLAAEATLLQRPRVIPKAWRAWTAIFLLAPAVALVLYLASRLPYPEHVVLRKGFTGGERLLTEARILWEYLYNAFLPRATSFGPFHDAHPVARSLTEPLTLLAVCGWLAAIAAALCWRRRYPLFAFAVLWYIGGHLLESTTIPLDLYYEHRNYLPLVGPVYAACALLARVPVPHRRLAFLGATGYLAVCAFVLFSFASLWGNPALAFQAWLERSPDSRYAATAAMAHTLATAGPAATIEAIRAYTEDHPGAAYLGLYELKLACDVNPAQNHGGAVPGLAGRLRAAELSYSAITMLSQLAETLATSGCNGLDFESLRTLARALIENPKYSQNPQYNQLHHQLIALTYRYEGNHEKALEHLRRAVAWQPSRKLNRMMVFELTSAGEFDAAREYLADARVDAPWHPLRRYLWTKQLDELGDEVRRLESAAARAPGGEGSR